MAENDIIDLEKGSSRVFKDGIEPFINFIEMQEREFFKAKDFVTLYDLIFKMCIQRDPYNWSEAMYERYTKAIFEYLLTKVAPSLNKARGEYDTAFLKEWRTRWNNQKLIVKGLSKLFMYLDRFYTPNTDGILSLKEQGFHLYKENIFDQFSKYARAAILNAIGAERAGEEQDRGLLQDSVNCFVEMGYNFNNQKLKVYRTDLEKNVVEHAGEFYKRESRSWMDQDSCPNYLQKAERMLKAEKNRVESYLNRATLEPLTKECYIQLLKNHREELMNKKTGIDHLLTINSEEDLSRLYRLYKQDPADLEPIAEMVNQHIQTAGLNIVNKANKGTDSDPNHDLVTKLIQLHATYANIVNVCFEKSQVFQKALKKAFEDFINKDDRVSNLLAKFVNDVLKKGTTINVRDIEATLDNVVFLYGYIQEKDVFERNYQLFLSHRLLNGLCESEHNEKAMIAKLKTECGYQWTNKLEGMFKDVQLSKDLMGKFKKTFDTEAKMDMQLSVNVCTTGYWPSTKNIPCHLPEDISQACDKYKRFYLNQHSGHKLEWRMDQGRADVLVNFSAKAKHILVLTTYQMMILLVFNQTNRVTFKQILDITGIPKYEIANHLLSLCHPKVAIMKKKPNTKQLEESHQFMINATYSNPLKKVVVPLMAASVEPGGGGDDEEQKAIALQRRHQMDAAVVRIMKARKTLRHNLLVAEVISQLQARFKPKPNDIKKRVEALIEQEYLKRDKDDRSVYNYLA